MQNEWTLEIARLQVELAKWEEQVNVRDAHVDALKAEITKMDSDIIFLGTVVEGLQAHNSALKARIKELEGALKRFSDFILEECDEWPLAHEAARNAKQALKGGC